MTHVMVAASLPGSLETERRTARLERPWISILGNGGEAKR
jgi:hypothetical protein